MLLRLLSVARQGRAAAASSPAGLPALPAALSKLQQANVTLAARESTGPTAGRAGPPAAEVPAPPAAPVLPIDHALSSEEFQLVADRTLGELWTRIERGLREAEGEAFDYSVLPESHGLRVLLPYDGQMCIRKEPERGALVVETNLFEPYEDRSEIEFRPVNTAEWDSEEGESLPEFVGEALTKYLKTDVSV